MRSGSIRHAHGPRIPRGPGWTGEGLSWLRVPRRGRGYPTLGQAWHRAECDRQPAAAIRLDTAHRPAEAQRAATSESTQPSPDRTRPVDAPRTAGSGASLFRLGAMGGFSAAWIIAAVLLLALAVLSAVSHPPRLPSNDDIARASVRVPHERPGPGRI